MRSSEVVVAFSALAWVGCDFFTPCTIDSHCVEGFGDGWVCNSVTGRCVGRSSDPLGTGQDTVDTEIAVTETADTNTTDTNTYTGVVPALILNEVLYDPTNADEGTPDPPGDANNDGVYIHDEDEFVEICNDESGSADLSGFRLYDNEALEVGQPRHVFPKSTLLEPGQCIVVFGGGSPTGKFGGSVVQTATGGRLNLNNADDAFTMKAPWEEDVLVFEVTPRSDNPNESYTRSPDLTGAFVQHSDAQPGVLYSPGTRSNGTRF